MNPPIPRKPHEPSPPPEQKPTNEHKLKDAPKHPGGQPLGASPQEPPDWRQQSEPQPSAQTSSPEPQGYTQLEEPWTKSLFTASDPSAEGRATPQPTPPGGYTVLRTLTVQVYGATGKAAMYFVNEGTYSQYHGSQTGVVQDIRNRLSPPPNAVA